MKKYLNALPLPASALGLSCIGLANLYSNLPILPHIFLVVGLLILLAIGMKILGNFAAFQEQMTLVPIASTFGTFSMGLILSAKPLMAYSPLLSKGIWGLGLIIQLALIIYFTATFARKKKLELVLPSWFIVYVGIVTVSMTAPLFQAFLLGKLIFWFGFIAFFILLPIIIKRLKKMPLPKPLAYTIGIMAAPASLNLAGYLSVFETKNMAFVMFQLLLASALYVYVLFQLPKLVRLPFSPAQVGLTFPLVISATGMKMSSVYFTHFWPQLGQVFSMILLIELVIATISVLWVLKNYSKLVFFPNH
ncbi:TDT family transporter [Vagococcus humatus]|uniref:C4-dicarboxylate ABC transporter n=1 Tax=Vagococcus humatus TaxID=1889241 RepID=A0A3R9YXZ9_9ENTE|nr:TDT family transporter [Vagococcus humatus]RST90045.1 hypothetical protein C7P63_02915 [Vagococcus humatus]